MNSIFRHVALIGKYHAALAPAVAAAMRAGLEDIAQFLAAQGCEVVVERDTAAVAGMTGGYPTADLAAIGTQCDLGLVVGGDGTMLGIGRQLARHDVPLIGINQGRLGFITDIPLDHYPTVLPPMLAGEDDEEDRRTLMQAHVMRDGQVMFDALAMNDVVVNRGATSGMVELRVEVDGHFVANQRAGRPDRRVGHGIDGLIRCRRAGRCCIPPIPGWVLVPIAPHHRSRTGPSCCPSRWKSPSSSSRAATRAPISTCSRWRPCSAGTA